MTHRNTRKRMYNTVGSAARLRVPAKRLRLRVPRAAMLTIFVILLLGMMFTLQPQQQRPTVRAHASDTWWNNSWEWRKSFNVTGQTSTETNYVIEILVHRSTGSDSGNEVYISTKCEADFDDIRFTNDEASPTSLDYWIESTNGLDARMWVELDSITADGTDTFYMYYGYASATAGSNGANTFWFFDDFNGADTWTDTGTTCDVNTAANYMDWDSSASYADAEHAITTLTAGFVVEAYWYFSAFSGFSYASMGVVDQSQTTFGFSAGSDGGLGRWGYGGRFDVMFYENGANTYSQSLGQFSLSTTYHARIWYDGSDYANYTIYTDYWDTQQASEQISGIAFTDDPDIAICGNRDRTGSTGYADDFRIRTWIDDDPQAANWGSEEQVNQAPTIETNVYVDNLDDTDNMYSNARMYSFTIEVDDPDGHSDIDMVGIQDVGGGAATDWYVWYDHQTTTWSEGNGDNQDWIELSTGDCSTSTGSGGELVVEFAVWIEFAHPQSNDVDYYGFVNDTEDAKVDWTVSNTNYDIWVQPLLVTVGYDGLTDNIGTALRGDVGGDIEYHAWLTYTCSDFIPPTYTSNYADPTRCDIWVNSSQVGSYKGNVAYNETSLRGEVHMANIYGDDQTGLDQYDFRVVEQDAGVSGTRYNPSAQNNDYISDKIIVVLTPPTYTHIGIGQNMSGIYYSVSYDYDSTTYDGTCTLNDTTYLENSAMQKGFTMNAPAGDDTHGVSAALYSGTDFTGYWENVTCTWSHFWTKYADDSWFAHITVSALELSSGTTLPDGATVKVYENESLVATLTVASNQIGLVRAYDSAWTDKTVNWTVTATYTGGSINIDPYLRFYTKHDDVPIVHTMYVDVFDLEFTSTHVIITYETNWHNASLTVWINGSTPYYFSSEGIKIVPLPTATGYHNFTLLINGTAPLAQGTWDTQYTDDDGWSWREFGYEVPDYVLAEHIITFAFYIGAEDCMFVVVSDLSAVYLKAWDNDSLVIPQTLITNILKFDKTMTYGWHNVTCQVGSATYGWLTYYAGYDVVERIVYLDYYDAETGLAYGISYGDVVTLINGTQRYFVPFWVQGNFLNITILDYYGQVIDTSVVAYDEHITVGLTYYEVELINIGADTVRAVLFYGSLNRTIELQPYESTDLRFVLNNYTVWEQFISGYDIEGNVDWTTYREGVWELGTYQQVKKMQHSDWAERYPNSSNYAVSFMTYLLMVIGGVSGVLGIWGYIQRRELQDLARRQSGMNPQRKHKGAGTKPKNERKYDND